METLRKCRVCLNSKSETDFVLRGSKPTATCNDCSEERKKKDYCEHNTRYHDCSICHDPVIRRASSMLHGSRIADKKKGRICDLTFTSILHKIIETPCCVYCDVELGFLAPYFPNFCTIDRIDDNIGHTNENCVISCRGCNCSSRKFLQPNYWNIVNTLKHNLP